MTTTVPRNADELTEALGDAATLKAIVQTPTPCASSSPTTPPGRPNDSQSPSRSAT